MKVYLILPVLLLFAFTLSGQTEEIETWRSEGFLARTEKDYAAAIGFYEKIITVEPGDYDARLALGRLYNLSGEPKKAIGYFEEIFREDSTDVEAMNGLGESNGMLGNDEESVWFYRRALDYYQADVMQYLYLAKAYGNAGKTEQAIETYRAVIRIDETWSEAWAGIGRMYYWTGKPKTALVFYEKALELDPGNEEIEKEYQAVAGELNYSVSLSVGPVNEVEESYEINAMISKAGFEKRIDDHFLVQGAFLLDYSNRDYSDADLDTTRWYSNISAKGSWIGTHHTLSLFTGYSSTDNLLSSYGFNWKMNYSPGKITIKNSLIGGYDYFYYWNKVGSTSIADETRLEYRFLSINARYAYGIVDKVAVKENTPEQELTEKTNPYQSVGVSLFFRLIRNPEIKLGLNYSYLDYEYKSPLYYSPFGRNLTGASASAYYQFSRFFVYGSFAYNIGSEYNYEESNSGKMKKVSMDVDNWSANLELGYDYYPFSISIGGSNFYNPYYQNLTGFLAIKVLF